MGNTKKRIKRSKRVKMRKAKNTRKAPKKKTRKAKHTRKAPKKKTKQRGRGSPLSPPGFPPLPEGSGCNYVESSRPGEGRARRDKAACNKTYGCEWGDKLSWKNPMNYERCHKARVCRVKGEGGGVFNVPCYLIKEDNERHADLKEKLRQQNLTQVV